VIKHYKGVCHVFVDRDADLQMAEEIVINAKVQRAAVCNAMETLLVDSTIAPTFLPVIAQKLAEKNVELRVDDTARALLDAGPGTRDTGLRVKSATEQDWSTEYNDYILNVRIVDDVEQAIDHISRYGSAHSDSIVTRNEARARKFLTEVDSAAVYWNASTRFTDGGEFGFGREIGRFWEARLRRRGQFQCERLHILRPVDRFVSSGHDNFADHQATRSAEGDQRGPCGGPVPTQDAPHNPPAERVTRRCGATRRPTRDPTRTPT
jgi:glutamate-5-semialdehyde dehydrogenase